jgi:hypothetical protein
MAGNHPAAVFLAPPWTIAEQSCFLRTNIRFSTCLSLVRSSHACDYVRLI